MQQAAQTPVLDVALIQSTGLAELYGPRWKITFDMITCPVALELTRRLLVHFNEKDLFIDVHHPRASGRVPCSECLSVPHNTKDCKNVHAADSIARHSKVLTVNTGSGLPKLQDVSSAKKYVQQLQNLRRVAAPAVEDRLRAEEADRLAKVERKAKEAAEAAAKAAATEARAQREAKKHAEQDLARRQREKARIAYNLVTKQIQALQHFSRAGQASTESDATARAPQNDEPGQAQAAAASGTRRRRRGHQRGE